MTTTTTMPRIRISPSGLHTELNAAVCRARLFPVGFSYWFEDDDGAPGCHRQRHFRTKVRGPVVALVAVGGGGGDGEAEVRVDEAGLEVWIENGPTARIGGAAPVTPLRAGHVYCADRAKQAVVLQV